MALIFKSHLILNKTEKFHNSFITVAPEKVCQKLRMYANATIIGKVAIFSSIYVKALVSPNVTWGRPKKCHVLFEWPLTTKTKNALLTGSPFLNLWMGSFFRADFGRRCRLFRRWSWTHWWKKKKEICEKVILIAKEKLCVCVFPLTTKFWQFNVSKMWKKLALNNGYCE